MTIAIGESPRRLLYRDASLRRRSHVTLKTNESGAAYVTFQAGLPQARRGGCWRLGYGNAESIGRRGRNTGERSIDANQRLDDQRVSRHADRTARSTAPGGFRLPWAVLFAVDRGGRNDGRNHGRRRNGRRSAGGGGAAARSRQHRGSKRGGVSQVSRAAGKAKHAGLCRRRGRLPGCPRQGDGVARL